MVFLALVLAGVYGYLRLPVEMFPAMETPGLSVVVVYPGASSVDVEDRVTRPLEDALSTLAGVKNVVSTSTDNLGAVTCEFEFGTNLDEAAADIRERIQLVRRRLPDGIDEPSILKFDVGMMPVVVLAVTAGVGDVGQWQETVRLRIVERLQHVSGVGAVQLVNPSPEEVHVDVDRRRLEQVGLSLDRVGQAIQAQNLSYPLGNLVLGGIDYGVRLPAEFADLDDLRDLVVGASSTGSIVRLRDVAEVGVGLPEQRSVARFDGRPAQLLLVQKRSGANAVEVAEGVRAEVERANRELPHGLRVTVITDTSRFVRLMVDALGSSVFWGGLFVVVVVSSSCAVRASRRRTRHPPMMIACRARGSRAIAEHDQLMACPGDRHGRGQRDRRAGEHLAASGRGRVARTPSGGLREVAAVVAFDADHGRGYAAAADVRRQGVMSAQFRWS